MENFVIELLNSTSFLWLVIGALGAGENTSLAPCSLLTVPLLVGSAVGLSKNIDEKNKAVYFDFYYL